jgi:flagellar biosynthesis protein FlhG
MREDTQSATLERALRRGAAKVLAVASGKGGVGKTNVAANLAIALATRRHNVMLLDADLGLANVDVLLGLQPRFNLAHVVNGESDLDGTVIRGPRGLRIVPASSGDFSLIDLPIAAQASIIQAFEGLADQPDMLVVDTAAGISKSIARFVQAAGEAVVVVCDEPASITDAYAFVKVLSRHYGLSRFRIVTNQTRDGTHGRSLYTKLCKVADRYLDVVLHHFGNVPEDPMLKRAVQEQRAVVDAYPRSPSAEAFGALARSAELLPAARQAGGGIQFFFERLLAGGAVTARGCA